MGQLWSKFDPVYDIYVKTGDVKGSGTNSNVYITLVDQNGEKSRRVPLDVFWRDDFERGNVDVFRIRDVELLGRLASIELERDDSGLWDDWFLEWVQIKPLKELEKSNKGQGEDSTSVSESKDEGLNGFTKSLTSRFIFPCNRWIKANRKYVFSEYDFILPQFDPMQAQRVTELAEKKKQYLFSDENVGLPKQIKALPSEQSFSDDYKWDLFRRKIGLLAQGRVAKFASNDWKNLDEIKNIYQGPFKIPKGYNKWRSDEHFGQQRLQGCNPALIRRCDKIPDNFGVWEVMISPFLEGNTLKEVMEKKRLYIVDLKDLDAVTCKPQTKLCSPLALFYVRNDGSLVPVCIQLFQEQGEDNPIFLPSDSEYTWLLAKMYFNNADAAIHQSCSHLGFTHLICESIGVATHRELSPSHPIYRLLMPHFMYLFAINKLAVEKLICPDGWIDKAMSMGREGLLQILKKRYESWRFGVDGWLPADLEERGVDDTQALPYYPYRDDAILVHQAIHVFVTEIVDLVYGEDDTLEGDNEVQSWARCLFVEDNGCGFKSIPGGGNFRSKEELAQTITTIIFQCSVAHAAANFPQYDEYAFPANYPALLTGNPPRTKDALTEQDLVNYLPNKDTTVDIMVVTKLLSERGTRSLGDYEIQYMFEPNAVAAVKRFRQNLAVVSATIEERNKTRSCPYPYLDPKEVPNAISI